MVGTFAPQWRGSGALTCGYCAPDTEEVTGSNPVSPTRENPRETGGFLHSGVQSHWASRADYPPPVPPRRRETASYPQRRAQDVHRPVGRFVTRVRVDVARDARARVPQQVRDGSQVYTVLEPVRRGAVPERVDVHAADPDLARGRRDGPQDVARVHRLP
jgi:hypothetical protein